MRRMFFLVCRHAGTRSLALAVSIVCAVACRGATEGAMGAIRIAYLLSWRSYEKTRRIGRVL